MHFVGGEGEGDAVLPGGVVGHEVDVGVGDVGADDFPEGAGAEDGVHVGGDFFGGGHEGGVVVGGEVVDFVDFVFRDDEGVPGGFGGDVEEGEGFVVFVDFVAGDFASDDFRKNTAHVVIITDGRDFGEVGLRIYGGW